MPYIGKSPSAGVRQRYQYTATAGQTTFSGTDLGNLTLTYTDNNFVDVFQNGVLLKGGGTDYTATSGTSVVLATGASVSDVIEIIVYDVFSVGNFFNRTDSDSRYVNVDGDTMTGTLTLSGAVAVTGDYSSTTSGTSNLRLGVNAGNSIASGGNYNTVIGDEAGTAITTGDNNTLIGTFSGDALIATNGNTAVGSYALTSMTHGDDNVAIGTSALDVDTKGSNSVAVGRNALGSQNFTSETDVHNTAVGYQAGYNITTGIQNTLIGSRAGNSATTPNASVIVGEQAAGGATLTGNDNTCVGFAAGYALTSGANNLLLGHDAGRTGSPSGNLSTHSNVAVLGDDNITDLYCADTSISSSDSRDKADITDFSIGLNWVKDLRPVTYKWDKRTWYGTEEEPYGTPDGSKKKDKVSIGFLAQEVLEVEKANGFADSADTMLTCNLTEDGQSYGMKYERLVPVLVNAIKELSAKNDALEARIKKLEDA